MSDDIRNVKVITICRCGETADMFEQYTLPELPPPFNAPDYPREFLEKVLGQILVNMEVVNVRHKECRDRYFWGAFNFIYQRKGGPS